MEQKLIFKEGDFLNCYMKNRFRKNKNVLLAITGTTGSGKTYACLRICELWYRFYFKTNFPIENICFSVNEVVARLRDGNLKKGELLILEEAGANLGSLEFQTKVSKLFTYILQSFRSMNVGLLLNLPVLTMLNKQTRQLLHIHLITQGIDFIHGKSKLNPLLHQLNQHVGKSYWKHPVTGVNGISVKIENIFYSKPAQDIIDRYEVRKKEFVSTLVKEFEDKTDPKAAREKEKEKEKVVKLTQADLRKQEEEELFKDILLPAYLNGKTNAKELAKEAGFNSASALAVRGRYARFLRFINKYKKSQLQQETTPLAPRAE